MKIAITVSQLKLDDMGVTGKELAERVITQLDDAALPNGRGALSLCGFDVVVTVAN